MSLAAKAVETQAATAVETPGSGRNARRWKKRQAVAYLQPRDLEPIEGADDREALWRDLCGKKTRGCAMSSHRTAGAGNCRAENDPRCPDEPTSHHNPRAPRTDVHTSGTAARRGSTNQKRGLAVWPHRRPPPAPAAASWRGARPAARGTARARRPRCRLPGWGAGSLQSGGSCPTPLGGRRSVSLQLQ